MRRQYTFRGRVQGVGFRATAREVATGFVVSGWVRNEPDNSVLMEVQGSDAEIDAMITRLREIMQRNIASFNTITVPDIEGEPGFSIRR